MEDQGINGASAPDAVPDVPTELVEESGPDLVAEPDLAAEPDLVAEPDQSVVAARRGRRRSITRFLIAFMFGLLAVLTVSAGALAAYESSNVGRILPGVHAGSVDLSGLTPAAAAARLRQAYASLGDGTIVLSAAGVERTVKFSDLGRRVDADGIVALAMGVGREGPVIERIASNIRMFVRGSDITPFALVERVALRHEIAVLAAQVAVAPTDAAVTLGETGFTLTPGTDGRIAEIDKTLAETEDLLVVSTTPSPMRIELPVSIIEPDVTTAEATAARDAAIRIAADTTLLDAGEEWMLTATQIRSWISFERTGDGGYRPIVAREAIEAGLAPIATEVAITPVNATYLLGTTKQVVGVTNAKNGRALDVPGTVETLINLVKNRVDGLSVSRVLLSVTTIEPELTTAEATKTAPLMQPISDWTTYFPIGIKNGQGANIWIPARQINGYVVLPGQTFDFWKAIGPVTRAAGYKDGGAIIDGKTEPQGALAGGICSCSTTLFNAALRAGLDMGARRNHYYYIDRYPIGLDATVFQSGSGSVQTMSFKNDTKYPILIRGTGWSVGSKGYVKFVIWSVPTGRTVSLSKAIVKNIKPASDTTVYTTDLKPGVRERVEYPVDGKDVWVTRTVTDATGKVIHQETYYSHYARITGVLRIGKAAAPAPTPTPLPAPALAPSTS
ncbi:MAG: VanW family protein [Chloroflexota bacterium]